MEVYFIDVEGGQATLFVSPAGESMLVDTGWTGFNNRDALRIAGAQAVRAMLLVIPVLFVAGAIEAFVSPSDAPALVKLGTGVVTGALLWSYIAFAGRTRATGA